MSTIEFRTATVPRRLPLSLFARVAAFIVALFDIVAEAKAQANAAHQRYPFGRW
jgi:hypothetical protein